MIKSNLLKNDLTLIDIDKDIINKLNKIGINIIEELCKTNRKRLTNFDFNTEEIKKIIYNAI